jgi:hypothetical protein
VRTSKYEPTEEAKQVSFSSSVFMPDVSFGDVHRRFTDSA